MVKGDQVRVKGNLKDFTEYLNDKIVTIVEDGDEDWFGVRDEEGVLWYIRKEDAENV